jgi:hypothetical protein
MPTRRERNQRRKQRLPSCAKCGTRHGVICWVERPELAPDYWLPPTNWNQYSEYATNATNMRLEVKPYLGPTTFDVGEPRATEVDPNGLPEVGFPSLPVRLPPTRNDAMAVVPMDVAVEHLAAVVAAAQRDFGDEWHSVMVVVKHNGEGLGWPLGEVTFRGVRLMDMPGL